MRIVSVVIVVALALTLPGCNTPLAEVSGTVLIDGKPLPEGEIILEAVDKSKAPAVGKISNGAYTVQAEPGSKVVRILASRPASKPDPVMGAAARESMIAPEFNVESKLRHEMKVGKQTGVDFEVEALPVPPA